MMKHSLFLALLLPAASAMAGQCEDNFAKKGNPLTGTTYTASVSLANVSVDSVIGQMRGVAIKRNMDILSEDARGGTLLIEERESALHKPIAMTIAARNEGGTAQVQMVMKTGRGALGSAEGIKKEMCDMLAQIKSGKAGAGLASSARKSPAQAQAVEISSRMLADQIKRQAEDSKAAVSARNQGKLYRLTGRVESIDSNGGKYNVSLDNGARSSSISSDYLFQPGIICKMAADQTAYALSLHEGEKVTLTGMFSEYDSTGPSFWLKDCRGN